MSKKLNGNVAYSAGLRRVIDRRRFLALCGGAAATLIIASCVEEEATPEVDQVTLSAAQVPEAGAEPLHSEAGSFYLINNDNELLALYSRCTHQGCGVEWKPDQQGFACPCHGSQFDRRGIRTDGPAERPLDLMAIRSQPDGSLVIDTGKITQRGG